MNIAALMNVTVANGYTAAEEATAAQKLEEISAYEKEQALLAKIKPQTTVEDDPYVPITRHDAWLYIVAGSLLNAAIWATEPRKS